MNRVSIELLLVPRKYWEIQPDDPLCDISDFVREALIGERRLKKGVNLSNEQSRYMLCCRRIQDIFQKRKADFERVSMSDEYTGVLHRLFSDEKTRLLAQEARLASCFFPPEHVKEHIERLESLLKKGFLPDSGDMRVRLEFYKRVLACEAGVIELECYRADGQIREMLVSEQSPAPPLPEEFDEIIAGEKRFTMEEALRAQILRAIKSGEAVNFSNQPHSVIVEVLHDFVYRKEPGQKEKLIRVSYMDGTEAEPFPIYCLDPVEDILESSLPSPLKASLISMRHPEMDEIVHFAWFRNSKVSWPQPFAATDAYCTKTTTEELASLEESPLHLHLYQTGLETAIVGFYRALAMSLIKRRDGGKAPWVVVPMYKEEGGYKEGKLWS